MSEPAFIGIDLGGTVLKIVATRPDGTILGSRRVKTESRLPRAAILGRIAALVGQLRDEIAASSSASRLTAVGLAVPGVVDAPAGRVEFTVALAPEWNGFAAVATLEELIGLPTVLINDAQAATVGEHVQGGGRGYRDFVCITVGTGIGGGLVLDDRLYTGSRGMSGVLGHTTVIPDGPLCGCGNRGCLELVASGTAIARTARQRELAFATVDRAGDDDAYSPRAVAAAAVAGDARARALFEEAGTYLGVALGNVVCLLNPRAIVVGGGVSRAGELLLEPIRQEIKRRTAVFSEERGGVEVIQSPLGGDAGAIGSAQWAAQGAR
jgi:glucokinase